MALELFRLDELAAARPSVAAVGGKARNLGLLCAAGLPVPEGFVLPAGSDGLRAAEAAPARPPPAADATWDEVCAAAARLGPVLAVRSSSAAEDQADGAAPGLFSSQLDIRPDGLAQAVAAVIASARSPAVGAYLERRGRGAPTDLAVIVQRQVGGASGVLYTRPPGQPDRDEVWIEAAGPDGLASRATARRTGEPLSRDPDFPLEPDQLAGLIRLAVAAERAIASDGGADVEWVAEETDVETDADTDAPGARPARAMWLVQARPIRHPAAPSSIAAAAGLESEIAFSRADPHVTWRWDASHNPDPLTPAQIGLVDLVGDIAPSPMRVVDGYLYVATSPAAPLPAGAAPTAAAVEAIFDDVRAAITRALAPVETTAPASLPDALGAYRAVYRQYMVRLTPVLQRARAALRQRGEPIASPESAVGRALRRGDRDALDALAPVWDVAAATYGERVDATAAAAEPDRAPPPPAASSDLAGAVRAVGEEDDLLFFRAQRAVRRALLAVAEAWRLSPLDDVFYLPLAQVRAHVDRAEVLDPAAAHRIAQAARAAREAQRGRVAPGAFRDGRSISATAPAGAREVWRGRTAATGTARGRALHLGDLGRLDGDPRGRVIVARSVTPAVVIDLAGAAALVCEQGGVLDHAAALARELALPCVVGCAGVWAGIRSGDEVFVDGDVGLVLVLSVG